MLCSSKYGLAAVVIVLIDGVFQIDPDLPLERKRYIAEDSDARFVFTSEDVSSPSLFGSLSVFIDNHIIRTAVNEESSEDLDIASPDALAFLLYTSGKTILFQPNLL